MDSSPKTSIRNAKHVSLFSGLQTPPSTPTKKNPTRLDLPYPSFASPHNRKLSFSKSSTTTTHNPVSTANGTSISSGDRFIPNRNGIDLTTAYSLTSHHDFIESHDVKKDLESDVDHKKRQEANMAFQTVLKAELFGDKVPNATPPATMSGVTNNHYMKLMMKSSTTPNSSSSSPFNSSSLPARLMNLHINTNISTSNTASSTPISATSHSNSYSSINHIPYNSNDTAINLLIDRRFDSPSTRRSIINPSTPTPRSANSDSTPTSSFLAHSSSTEKITMVSPVTNTNNLLSFKTPIKKSKSRKAIHMDLTDEMYSVSPVRTDSQKLLLSPHKKPRYISKVPYRVLDAPDIADDFYLNLVDWGSQNVLAVGLGSSVYLWDASSGSVDRLCDVGENNKVTSLSWIGSGSHLAIGTNQGMVEIWDAERTTCTRSMTGHSSRVAALSWNEHMLSSGSKDRSILNRDVRVAEHYVHKIDTFHEQEICGLKWNVEENKLASGGNDNKLFVWDGSYSAKPLYKYEEHSAAIKAISWSPHKRGVLASGGGTADRRIKIWNTLTGAKLNDVDTGSQVCNLLWSKNSNELVSTHGYSKNQVVVWKYSNEQPSSYIPTTSSNVVNEYNSPIELNNNTTSYQLSHVASLTGHTYRVLYLALSPDGETIVTGAGDETLRFWKVFDKGKSNLSSSVLLDSFLRLR